MEWQPGSTAPKEGTRIIAWWPHLSKPVLAWVLTSTERRGNWTAMISAGGNLCYPKTAPTHWMPLPPPPATEEDSR